MIWANGFDQDGYGTEDFSVAADCLSTRDFFSRDAFTKLTGDNKELWIIPGAVHTDLYDRKDVIPFDRIEGFNKQYLK